MSARIATMAMMTSGRRPLPAAVAGAAGGVAIVASLMLVSRIAAARLGEGRILCGVPPAAAEGAEQRGGVGETLHVCLHLGEGSLLILLLGGQHLQLGVLAGTVLLQRQVAIIARGAERAAVGLVTVGVVLQRLQRVGHFHEG